MGSADRGAVYLFWSGEVGSSDIAEDEGCSGTYAAYLHTEIMRVVPTYLTFGAVVLCVRLFSHGWRFLRCRSEHEGEGGDHGSFGAVV